MTGIDEKQFARICAGIREDADAICRHNPIAETRAEILLWMLLGCLTSYLNLSEQETPCFAGAPTTQTYRDAINFVLRGRKLEDFNAEKYLNLMENGERKMEN